MYSATSVVNDLNMLENRLSSVFDQGNTSFGTNPSDIIIGDNDATVQQPSTPTEQIQSSIITDDNRPVQFDPSKHIMISYHHESSFELCRRICARLRVRINEFICINLSNHFIDRIEVIKYGWMQIIYMVLFIKEWLKQLKIPTLFSSV